MKTFDLLLSSINDVKDFVNIVSKYDFDVDLTSGRYETKKLELFVYFFSPSFPDISIPTGNPCLSVK